MRLAILFGLLAGVSPAVAQQQLFAPEVHDALPTIIERSPRQDPDTLLTLFPAQESERLRRRQAAVEAVADGLARAVSQDLAEPSGLATSSRNRGSTAIDDAGDVANLSAATSIELSIDTLRGASGLTTTGSTCIPNSRLDLPGWGDEDEPFSALAQARQAAVGDDGIISSDSRIAIAKAFLYLGFGAEAGAVLTDTSDDEAALLIDVGRILDGRPVDSARFEGQIACPGMVSFWAALATDPGAADWPSDTDPILATLKRLPRPLRKLLAPRLVDALLAADREPDARVALSAVDRGGVENSRSLALTQAALGERAGDYGALTEPTDLTSLQAMLRVFDAASDSGQPVSIDTIAEAEALARGTRGDPDATRLAEASLLARIKSGDVLGSLSRLTERRFRRHYADIDRSLALRDLWLAAAGADDQTFLRVAFALDDVPRMDPAQALTIARRLGDVALTDRAAGLLATIEDAPARSQIDAELQLVHGQDANGAKPLLDLVTDTSLRARLFTQLGRHSDAAREHRADQEPMAAEVAALRGGHWDLLRDAGSDPIATAATLAIPSPPDAANAELLTRTREETAAMKQFLRTIEDLDYGGS